MAKKKTENIKAAPVLRAQSEDPTPEQTGTRTYQIMDPWKDRGVTNLVDVKAVDGKITELLVNGEPAGGGGGGYTTATITVTNNMSESLVQKLITCNYIPETQGFMAQGNDIRDGATVTLENVVIGPGGSLIKTGDIINYKVAITGNAEEIEDLGILVRGNCALVFTNRG